MAFINPYMLAYPQYASSNREKSDPSLYSSAGSRPYQGEYSTDNHQTIPTQDFTTKQVDKYVYCNSDKLGQGEFSYVYKGMNTLNNQNVAVKVIDQRKITQKIFHTLLMNEIEILKTVSSPYILNLHEVMTTANNIYIITEFCNQGDLGNWLKTKRYLQEDSALKVLLHLVKALKYLHEEKIIHRDIKPANILFFNNVAKLADFGFAISKSLSKNQFSELDGFSVGTPLYMSPETYFLNQYNFKTDIWSLGIVFYEMIFGKTPFQSDSEPELVQRLQNYKINQLIPIQNGDVRVSQGTMEIIQRMLSYDPKNRINIHELHQILMKQVKISQKIDQKRCLTESEKIVDKPRSVKYIKLQENGQIDNQAFSKDLQEKKPQSTKKLDVSPHKIQNNYFIQNDQRSDIAQQKMTNETTENQLEALCDYLDEIIKQIQNCDALSLVDFNESKLIYMIYKGKTIMVGNLLKYPFQYNDKGRNSLLFKKIWHQFFQYHLRFDIEEDDDFDFQSYYNKNIRYDSGTKHEIQSYNRILFRILKLIETMYKCNQQLHCIGDQQKYIAQGEIIHHNILKADFLIILYQILELYLKNPFLEFLQLTDIGNLAQYKAQNQISYKHWSILVEKIKENQIEIEE